jgi:phosphatidylinositol alpha-1,6-mannosyltransferase
MTKGKILLFTTDYPPAEGGGILTHSHFLVDTLRPLGWDFFVLSEYYIYCSEEEIKAYSKKEGYAIQHLPDAPTKISFLKKVWLCCKITRKYKPDLIIGSGRHTTWYAAIISRLLGIPLVTIGHGTEFTQKTSRNDFKWNKKAYGQSSLLISISHFSKGIIESIGIKPREIAVIHNAANESVFKPLGQELIKEFKLKKGLQNKRIILATGALSERKGQKIMIRALPRIIEQFPDIFYVAIGLPYQLKELYNLARELNLQEHILFPGVVDQQELVYWLNACDIYSMMSINDNGDYEGFGIAVLEAALCGKTAVVSDNGGLPEAVKNGITGLVVPENDPEKTAEAVILLLENEKLKTELEINANQHVMSSGTYHSQVEKYDHYLSQLLKK